MNGYQTPYERSRSLGALVKPLLIIGLILIVLVFGAMWLIDYILGQQIVILQEDFSTLAVRQMEDTYHVDPADALTPVYTFEQGDDESSTHYTGIVMKLEADVSVVLQECFGMDPDGEEYLNRYNDFQDYFVDDCYRGDTETILIRDGKAKAIRFTTEQPGYVYFFFEEGDVFYLMARRAE